MANAATSESGPSPALIMFFAANPVSTPHVAIDRELKEIERKLQLKSCTVPMRLKAKWATQPGDLLEALNQDRPVVVHFSGHGAGARGLVFQGQDNHPTLVSTRALRKLFQVMKDDIRIVVLNACYAEEQALAISETIDCVVGMRDTIGDDAARVFAVSFYQALSHGRDVQQAFDQSIAALALEGIPEESTPTLIARAGVDPSAVALFNRNPH
jgi:hypothetical protein